MKKLMSLLFAAIVTIGASAPVVSAPAVEAAPVAAPPGASLFEIVRWISTTKPTDHNTGPDGSFYAYLREGSLGFISATPFAGSHALYRCGRTYKWNGLDAIDYFTSASSTCEGIYPGTRIGYVSSSQIPGTVPLYRCLFGQDQFDSIQGCEGFPVIGVLGFVFA